MGIRPGLPARMCRGASANRAKMPPSPRLSARMMKTRYLTKTTSVNAQKIKDRMPNRSSRLAARPLSCPAACKHSFSV